MDNVPPLFCTLLTAICTIGLIVTVTILFIDLVDHGLQSAGIGGFILSLVSPIAVFVTDLCVSHELVVNFYHNVLASSSKPGSANSNEINAHASGNHNSQTDETTPLIRKCCN